VKNLSIIVLFLLFLASPLSVFATISEFQVTGGASYVDVTTASTTPTVYAGVSGASNVGDCATSSASDTCNNCTASILPCNEKRILPALKLRVEFKTDNANVVISGAKIKFTFVDNGAYVPVNDEASTILAVNTTLYASIPWSSLCEKMGSNSSCSVDLSGSKAVKVGIDSNADDELDEVVSFQVHIVGNTMVASTFTYHSNCGTGQATGSNEGFCYFKLHKGDGKAYIEDETAPESYNLTPVTGANYKYVRFYYDEGDINCAAANFAAITPLSPSFDLTTSADGTTYYLDERKLTGLDNGIRYYFRMANVDVAGNIYYFSSATGDTGFTGTPFLNCTDHSVVPEEVIGLLDGKSDFSCFIATAAYGTSMARELEILREFRDRFLKTNAVGRAFVNWYYVWSPKVANWLRKKTVLRAVVRGALWPVVMLAKFSLWSGIFGIVLFMSGGLAFCLYGLRRYKRRV
jgi:hypothetical protein